MLNQQKSPQNNRQGVGDHYVKNHITWPKSGAILWACQGSVGGSSINAPLENSEVYQFACEVLCHNSPKGRALLNAHTHPDLCILKPAEDSRWIKIDQVRALIEWSQCRPHIATQKVAIIVPADAMNLQAANALLKTLEESSADLLFILMTDRMQALPATIVSRCHIIRSRTAESYPDESNHALHQQVLEDLQCLSKDEADPINIAAKWVKQDLHQILYWVMVILNKAIRASASIGSLQDRQGAFKFLDQVYQAKRALQENPSVNNQLLIESLLIRYLNSDEIIEF